MKTIATLLALSFVAGAGRLQHRARRRPGHPEGRLGDRRTRRRRNERPCGTVRGIAALCPRLIGKPCRNSPCTRASWPRWTARTSTPTRSSPSSSSSRSARPASGRTCSTRGATWTPASPGQDPQQRKPNPDFVLNQPRYQGASILLARKNFGCGSSREHAPWALDQYGFRSVIAPSFADIFFNNCFKNGLLPIVLRESQVSALFDEVAGLPRLPAHHRPGAPGRGQAARRGDRLRGAAVSQVLPAQRLRRHRPDPAPGRQDQGLRSPAPGPKALAGPHPQPLRPASPIRRCAKRRQQENIP